MRSFARKYLAWVWMTAVLTATVGVSVREVYCYCVGKTSFSVFSSGSEGCAAHKTPVKPACCAQEKTSTQKSCCTEDGAAEKGCTKKSTQVFQLKTEYTVEQSSFFFGKKNFDFPAWLHDVPMFKRSLRAAICARLPLEEPQPPPSPSGRDRCLRHCISRC